jgi:hypothetical protein
MGGSRCGKGPERHRHRPERLRPGRRCLLMQPHGEPWRPHGGAIMPAGPAVTTACPRGRSSAPTPSRKHARAMARAGRRCLGSRLRYGRGVGAGSRQRTARSLELGPAVCGAQRAARGARSAACGGGPRHPWSAAERSAERGGAPCAAGRCHCRRTIMLSSGVSRALVSAGGAPWVANAPTWVGVF